MMDKNVLIPISLFTQICDLLEYWDVSQYDPVIQFQHLHVLRVLDLKRRRLGLRDDYAQIIRAGSEDDRDQARIRYLQKKSWLRRDEDDCPF